MTRALAWLPLALLLAGCADDPAPAFMPTAYEDPNARFGPIRELREVWVANGTFALGAAQPRQEAMVTLLNGTQQVVYTVTFESGAVAAFHADLDGCPLELTGPAPATGQSLSKDCGTMEGVRTLVLEQSVGVVNGRYGVRALTWHTVLRT
jgi:hypothetical protein